MTSFLLESSNEEMTNEEGIGGKFFSLSRFLSLLFPCRALIELRYFDIFPDEKKIMLNIQIIFLLCEELQVNSHE